MLSALVYYIHYTIFRDAYHIFFYLIADIAFVFIEVLLVTLVLQGLLSYREQKTLLKKLNMVIGAFFSEAGTDLMRSMSFFDAESSKIAKHLIVNNEWLDKDFRNVSKSVLAHIPVIDHKRIDLALLKEFLAKKRDFLLALLENPNLLEHESFTNLLWAVFHLAEELCHRKNPDALSNTDREHLAGDIKRVYNLLISEWLMYMSHLKADYPYLFSLAIRTNPFDANASAEVK
ncbi:MAG: hypothetical protein NTZ48_06210 [Candidatus Omnitrophica bacterium]|nr:hypothetical protein [Candidatus Omnitrophota bacterium]